MVDGIDWLHWPLQGARLYIMVSGVFVAVSIAALAILVGIWLELRKITGRRD